jgi:site-specific recombinase XerC
MLGHADVSTTEFYTQVAMSNLREAENAIEKGLSYGVNRKVRRECG